MAGALGILAAVVARDRTGEGQHIDISMLDVQLSMLSYTATMHLISGLPAERYGNEHGLHVPYNAYKTATGYLFLAVVVDNHWAALAKALSGMKLADAVEADVKYLTSERLLGRLNRLSERDAINEAVTNVLATRHRDEWLADLSAAGIPVAPVNTVEDALADDQAIARRMVVDIPHPAGATYRAPGNPIKMSAANPDFFSAPPRAGEDTQSVLRDVLGYDEDAIDSLVRSGAVERIDA
jgi:crotonobetainyl-CoA:carnitine CoA-transferase CaiB-like acyl-CoA transferase